MRYIKKLSLLAFLGIFLGITSEVSAQTISDCNRSLGEAFLDVNNVRARILNTGGLFYRGEPHVYEVPKGSGSNAIFASGIWIAGQVGGQLRAAATRYGEWEFWAGPLDDQGNPPADCDVYDRVYKVSRSDVDTYVQTGSAIPDLQDWPTGLGAPTWDADGNLIEILDQPFQSRQGRVIDLAAGERPALLGDQTIWWVMNDRGNQHTSTDSPPIGLEAHGSAFAFDVAGDIGNATFYKFKLFYKGQVPLTNTYLSIFSDPDLGDFGDDYVGSDTTLGLGFVYNSDNEDIGSAEAYGTPPPAAGYDFFQGPIVPSVGDTAKVSGVKVPDFKNLSMTSFIFYNNGGGVTEDPQTGEDYYNYQQANWKDGKKITFGGNGRDFSEIPTNFMFTGDPAQNEFWSEVNSDNANTAIDPGDRRFAMSTGPFTINPGDEQEIVFGLVFAKGADNLDSVAKLRNADALAQAAFDVDFILPQAPAKPLVTATPGDGQVTIEWTNSPFSNNYLESYTAKDPFAPLDDNDYEFEGYRVIQYAEIADQTGATIATYDVDDGVTQVIDGFPGTPTSVTMQGNDGGVQTYHVVGGLTNYKTYYFGVQALAYNEGSFPKVFGSSIARFQVTPKKGEAVLSTDALDAATSTATPDISADRVGIGQGVVTVDVINPEEIMDADYTVQFYDLGAGKTAPPIVSTEGEVHDARLPSAVARKSAAGPPTYDIMRDGEVIFDGSITGEPAPQRKNVVVLDGLQFSITGPEPGFLSFLTVANAAGPLDPPDLADFAWNNFPTYACPDGSGDICDRPTRGYQQSTNDSRWAVAAGGAGSNINDAISRWTRGGSVGDYIKSFDFEWRFVGLGNGGWVWDPWDGADVFDGGFELWKTGIGTPDDPSDDYRMIPIICTTCGGDPDAPLDVFNIGGDNSISSAANDPQTNYVYWYEPENTAPGDQGFQDFFFGSDGTGDEVFARMVAVQHNGGEAPPYDVPLPEVGTIFQINTLKPNQPGDTFSFSTAGFGATAPDDQLKKERVADIGIVPNPYKGASIYETSQLIDQVRFTNLPSDKVTLSVFTLNGSLIKTIEKPEGVRLQSWNLTTDNNLPIASGLYLIHVDVEGVGTKVIKFAVVKKRIQLNVF